ncbi:MAG: ABC transporter permease, partial [Ramlibacter sp.]
MLPLLATYSWQEVRHHAWRSATAVLAVMLGVALAFSVHLINASALDEFAGAARSAGGQPDVELRAVQGAMDEALYRRIATDAQVAVASPVVELQTLAVSAAGARATVRVLGVDAFVVASLAPSLLPRVRDGDRLAIVAPGAVFLNAAAQRLLPPDRVQVQSGLALRELRVAGTVAAGGGPLLVMDIGAAQDFFGRGGQLSRIDVRLRPGVSRAAWLRALDLPPQVQAHVDARELAAAAEEVLRRADVHHQQRSA